MNGRREPHAEESAWWKKPPSIMFQPDDENSCSHLNGEVNFPVL
jgi:hypothetical protein